MRVEDIMTPDPVTIAPEAPLAVALKLMRERQVRHLPVVDTEGRLVGILTDRDLRQASFARLRALREADQDLQVQSVMTWALVVIHPTATIAHAARVMFERRVGSLPVVEGGRLVGIVTERDLLRAVMEEHPELEPGPEAVLW